VTTPLLQVNGLSVSYGPVAALRSLDLTVGTGQIVVLLGANGAGKSTTLGAIAGVVKPSSGSISFEGRDISAKRAHEIVRQGLALVPENRGVLGDLTVKENLQLAAAVASGRRPRGALDPVYELFPRLRERSRQRAGSLSGGEQQMLAIGRALVTGAHLMLIDEPSLGLAPKVVREIFGVIGTLREQGTTVLLVEQNARAALEIADWSYVMERGEVALSGRPDELLTEELVLGAYLGGDTRATSES
jgi:branched-chain amino acid transport system ATP-binding protein